MSINFGYGGYGMMNGMNMYGANSMNMGTTNSQNIGSQYNCPLCYQNGAMPYNYRCYVNPLPKQVVNPSFFSRVIKRLFGG